MITLPFRILLIMLGWFVVPIAILTAKDGKFRKPFYIWDNEEDGYTSEKKYKWYAKHLGKEKLSAFDYYRWSAWRNPCFNLRYVPWFSCDTVDAVCIRFEGNTYFKKYHASFEKRRELIFYNFTCISEDKRRNLCFWLLPISKTKSIKIIFGWKFYPYLYLDDLWREKITNSGWPKYKNRAIFTCGISIKSM